MNLRVCVLGTLLAVAGSAASPVRAGDDHGHEDITVGYVCVSPGGQLEIEFDFDEITHLDPVTGILEGFALDDPGFATLEEDELDEGFCVLAPGSSIVFEIVSIDPALRAHTPGFTEVLDGPGDQWAIGAPPFDSHLTWHIDSTQPAYVANQLVWSVTFRLLDVGTTAYLPSDEFTVRFSNVECEVGGWLSADCNLNGLDDACELAIGGSAVDSDGDGLLDDCDCDVTTLMAGDVNGDQSTDIADIVHLLDGLFAGGSPPATFASADGNGSGFVDVGDAVFLISFLFEGGPSPLSPCL
ncbi:MAG: dockerin type I repeat-containing protein [Planctomycetota bacterium]